MDKLLFSKFPAVPTGFDGQLKKAIVVKQTYRYDDSIASVPEALRNHVPQQLKKNGILELYKGDQGFLYNVHPKGEWGMALFVFSNNTIVHVVLPLNIIDIGANFRPFAGKAADLVLPSPPPVNYTGPIAAQPGNPMTAFIRTFWRVAQGQQSTLSQLGLLSVVLDQMFGASFQANVDSITSAFTSQVAQVLGDGSFSLNDLLHLRHITKAWPGDASIIYVRIYTHQDQNHNDVERCAAYVGRTVMPWRRHTTHNNATLTSNGYHYRIARRSLPQHWHMIPLCLWQTGVPQHVLDMAEQTMIVLLNTYGGWLTAPHHEPSQSIKSAAFMSQCQLITSFAATARNATNWPAPPFSGCNCQSPIFWTSMMGGNRQITCIRMFNRPDSQRTITTYRTPVHLSHTERHGKPGVSRFAIVMVTGHGRRATHFSISKSVEEHHKLSDVDRGYALFEVMDDGRPHPLPWIGCPSVGTFKDFDRASSLGVRFMWFSKSQNSWLSIPILKQQLHMSQQSAEAIAGNLMGMIPNWFQAMGILQALEGIIYNESQDGLDKVQNFTVPVKQLQTNHLEQKFRLVTRQHSTRLLPQRASWQHNYNLMVQKFSSLVTHIGPSLPIAQNSDVMRNVSATVKHGGGPSLCDICYISKEQYPKNPPCEPADDGPASVCKVCLMLNRPCTFTSRDDLLRLWGEHPPSLGYNRTTVRNLSKYPSGPLKFLAFHLSLNEVQQTTSRTEQQPIEEVLAIGVDLIDGEILDEDINALDDLASVQS